MADPTWQAFIDRIAWEGSVHTACETLEAPLDPERVARLEGLNTGVLSTLGVLGERSAVDVSGDDATATAIARIDAKLDVLLEMFNRHLTGYAQLPPRREVRFNVRGIMVADWQPEAAGAPMLVRMHFDACVGLPLELPGHAGTVHEGGAFIAFGELADGVREGIEHLVFRQHRRLVAESRRDSQAPRR